ncbi:hypothetical protein V8G69_03115 [Gaetbulibacter sp. M235]|uniref:hypothetical protein n=1 Tax=Gaetbulibacter sp. M235 TaxID=3126510 RepID=UPI00374E501D
MKRIFITLIILTSLSCKKNPETYIEHLNGYWEIEKVILASGEEHSYNYNEFIDYFSVSDSLEGFRKKLRPLLNGTFEASKDAEQFNLKIEHDSLNIYYKTDFSNWKETILQASENDLKIINKDKNIYIYKPYKPIKTN